MFFQSLKKPRKQRTPCIFIFAHPDLDCFRWACANIDNSRGNMDWSKATTYIPSNGKKKEQHFLSLTGPTEYVGTVGICSYLLLADMYINPIYKDISYLKACLEYSYHHARSLWKFEFSCPFVSKDMLLRKISKNLGYLHCLLISDDWALGKKTNFQIFKTWWWYEYSRRAFKSETPLPIRGHRLSQGWSLAFAHFFEIF